MISKIFKHGYTGFSIGMSAYGFSRGLRAQENDKYKPLVIEKFTKAFYNSIFYIAPVFNILPTVRLLNRLEIEYKNLKKDEYKENYTEICGECYDTI